MVNEVEWSPKWATVADDNDDSMVHSKSWKKILSNMLPKKKSISIK